MSIPPDDQYAGEPQYPAPWTTSEPREGLRDTDAARIVCLAPDVCLTPVGSAKVPIPYQVHDLCGHDENYTPSVNLTGEKAMVLRSNTTHVHGDAPGTDKGVVSGTVEDVCEPVGHAAQVRAEGSNLIRHLDRLAMNAGNTVGEAIFVRDQGTYEPTQDTDPVPGSLRLSTDNVGAVSAISAMPSPSSFITANIGFLATASGTSTTTGFSPRPQPGLDPNIRRQARRYLERIGRYGAKSALKKAPGIGFFIPNPIHAPALELLADRGTVIRDATERAIAGEAELAIANGAHVRTAITHAENEILRHRAHQSNVKAQATPAPAVSSNVRVVPPPCRHLACGVPGSRFRGGAHGCVGKAYNKSMKKGAIHSHHIPADNYSSLPRNMGPALQMLAPDHRNTASYGSRVHGPRYAMQRLALAGGTSMRAIALDVADARKVARRAGHPERYDAAIAQMMVYAKCLQKHGYIRP